MARGKVAYKIHEGKHAAITDLVDIFSEGPDVIPASVANQLEHLNEWAASDRA